LFFAGVPAPLNAIANLTGVSGKEKKINHLCVLCAFAMKYLPFDFDRFGANLS